MAQLSIDLTSNQSRYVQVVFQRGKDVLDGELNEIGRLLRVSDYRSALVQESMAGDRATHFGFPRATNLEIVGNANNNEIEIKPVSGRRCVIEFRGYTFELTSTITLTTEATGSDRRQPIYLTITETEVDSLADPSIAIAQLGETAVRKQVVVTFAIGATGFDLTTLNTSAEPWELNGQKSGLLAEFRSASATPDQPVETGQIYKCWTPDTEAKTFFDQFSQQRIMINSLNLDSHVRATEADPNNLIFFNVGIYPAPGADTTLNNRLTMVDFSGTFGPLPNAGDCLVAYIPTVPSDTQVWTAAVPGATVVEGQIETKVENVSDYINGNSSVGTTEDGLYRKVVIVWRKSLALVDYVFCDGSQLNSAEPTASPQPYEGRLSFNNDNDLMEVHKTVNSPNDFRDTIPYARSLYIPRAGTMKCVFEHPISDDLAGARVFVRYYVAVGIDSPRGAWDGFVKTHNARWDPSASQWVADVSTRDAIGIFEGAPQLDFGQGRYDFQVHRSSSTASSWAQSAWDNGNGPQGYHTAIDQGGSILNNSGDLSALFNFNTLDLNGNLDPISPASAVANTLYAVNIPKAFGKIKMDSDGAFGVTTTVEPGGFNISSASYSNSGGDLITINWGAPFKQQVGATHTGYTVTATLDKSFQSFFSGDPVEVFTRDADPAFAEVRFSEANVGSVPIGSTIGIKYFSIVVFGEQQ